MLYLCFIFRWLTDKSGSFQRYCFLNSHPNWRIIIIFQTSYIFILYPIFIYIYILFFFMLITHSLCRFRLIVKITISFSIILIYFNRLIAMSLYSFYVICKFPFVWQNIKFDPGLLEKVQNSEY